jgi:hypothetical protein
LIHKPEITFSPESVIVSEQPLILGFEAVGDEVRLSFPEIEGYEELFIEYEISSRFRSADPVFEIEYDGKAFPFSFYSRGRQSMVFDCEGMEISGLKIKALTEDLQIKINGFVFRKTEYGSIDYDITAAVIEAIQSTGIGYGVKTALAQPAVSGDDRLYLESIDSIPEYAVLKIGENEYEVSDCVDIFDRSVTLTEPIDIDIEPGEEVIVVAPVCSEDYHGIENDPVIGVSLSKIENGSEIRKVCLENAVVSKVFFSDIFVTVYIDTKYKDRLLYMARQYEKHFTECITIELEGESVVLEAVSDGSSDETDMGNNPRVVFTYQIQPQPIRIKKEGRDIDLIMESI